MKRLALGLVLALALATPALAAQAPSISLNEPAPVAAGSEVTFTVNASGVRNPHVILDCDAAQYRYLAPVVGGQAGPLPVAEGSTTCTASVIRHPQYNKPLASVTFAATP